MAAAPTAPAKPPVKPTTTLRLSDAMRRVHDSHSAPATTVLSRA